MCFIVGLRASQGSRPGDVPDVDGGTAVRSRGRPSACVAADTERRSGAEHAGGTAGGPGRDIGAPRRGPDVTLNGPAPSGDPRRKTPRGDQ